MFIDQHLTIVKIREQTRKNFVTEKESQAWYCRRNTFRRYSREIFVQREKLRNSKYYVVNACLMGNLRELLRDSFGVVLNILKRNA